jgi:outer membrane protein OmpA-like peptidoglycan-associated protein
MRRITFFIAILFTLPVFSQYNYQTCHLGDTAFLAGVPIRTYAIRFELNKPTLLPGDSIFLDSLVNYLKLHKEIRIEIQVHGNPVPPELAKHIEMNRASAIKDYLHQKGIPNDQLIAKGYGGVRPVYLDKMINTYKTKAEKDSMSALNRRVEFQVRGILSKYVKTFSLNDTVFTEESVLRSWQYQPQYADGPMTLAPAEALFLDSIISFMQLHPSVKLEIGVHTDNTHDALSNNLAWSWRRAGLIWDYMIGKGISKDNLRANGYGSNWPLSLEEDYKNVKSPEERVLLQKKDNRTEFKIIFTQ